MKQAQHEQRQSLTVPETAKRLGVTGAAVRKWIQQGHFPGARRTGPNPKSHYLIPLAEVEAFEAKYR